MKCKEVFILFCCILAIPFEADSKRPDSKGHLYCNISIAIGSPGGGKASLTYLYKEHHEFAVGYHYYDRKRADIPANYEATQLGPWGEVKYFPTQSYSAWAITYGYVLHPKKRPDRLRYVLRGGLALGHLSTPYNYQVRGADSAHNMYTSNYTHDQREQTTAAIILNPTLDYTPSRWIGMSFGLYSIITRDFSGGGVTVGLLLGKVRHRSAGVLSVQ